MAPVGGKTRARCSEGKLPGSTAVGTRKETAEGAVRGPGQEGWAPLPALGGVSLTDTPRNALACSLRWRRAPDTRHPHRGRQTPLTASVTCDDARTLTAPNTRPCARDPHPRALHIKHIYTEQSPKLSLSTHERCTPVLNKITCNFEMFLRMQLLKHFGRKITASKCRRKMGPITCRHRTAQAGG